MRVELTPEPGVDFVAAFREGEARAREWIAGRHILSDLLDIVRDMPRGGEMGGLEAGFLSTIDAAVRGAPPAVADPAKAQAPPPTDVSPLPSVDVDELLRRRENERKAIFDRLARLNAEAWQEQHAWMHGLGLS